MNPDDQTIMNQITSVPQFIGAVHHCERLHQKIEESMNSLGQDISELRRTADGLRAFFRDGLPMVDTTRQTVAPASEIGVPVPEALVAEKTPSVAPRKHYEKVLAIVGASRAEPRYSDICAAWVSLDWEGARDEKFKEIVRAAIKTAIRLKKLKHKGGHNGTYHLA